jgi:Fic/DOC family protein
VENRFSDGQLKIVRFCAIECELQVSGERSVFWMVRAWNHAMDQAHRRPTEDDVLALGALAEPGKNRGGYRRVGVRVGSDIKGPWQLVPQQMAELVAAAGTVDAGQWFYQYEVVHPFVDGNGRTGQVLFNWLNGTLDDPVWAPDFWNDARRVKGAGA